LNQKALGYFGLIIIAALSFLAMRNQKPLVFMVLRDADTPEAFRVEIGLGSRDTHVEPLGLSPDQRKSAMGVLKDRDGDRFSNWAKELGSFHAVIGLPDGEEAWPSFWGTVAKDQVPDNEFDDLNWLDRFFLSWSPKPSAPPPGETPPGVPTPGTRPVATKPLVPEATKQPMPIATAIAPDLLRVEIQNGCGITGAGESVARRLKGAHLKLVGKGNADNFRHSQTILRTNLASSAAVEEIVSRLALNPSQVQTLDPALPGVDAVIVVGRDFRKLKEKWRERDRNGTQ
jgi:hypothetical protein